MEKVTTQVFWRVRYGESDKDCLGYLSAPMEQEAEATEYAASVAEDPEVKWIMLTKVTETEERVYVKGGDS